MGFVNTLKFKNQFILYHFSLDTVNHNAPLKILAVLLKSSKGSVPTGICVVPSLNILLLGFAFISNDKEFFKVHSIFFLH